MRVFYSIGPADIVKMHGHWARGEPDSSIHVPYARLFIETVDRLGADAWIITSNPNATDVQAGRFRLTHRPDPSGRQSGLGFHVGQVRRALRLVADAARFQPDVAFVAEGGHWWALSLMRLLGVQVVPSLHCVLWQKYKPPTRVQRTVLALNRWFFGRCCFAVMAVSNDISKQVQEMTPGRTPPILEFIPHYLRSRWETLPAANWRERPFRVLFAGRIERNKGPFDLLDIAKRFAAEGRDIAFDICGRGPALDDLVAAAKAAGLESKFVCHGFCDQEKLRTLLGQSHVVVVPTTTDFVEGFNKVVAEGVLAGRPVVTSAVVPALAYVRDAVLEVEADNVNGYRDAIVRLAEDEKLYEAKRGATARYRDTFLEPGKHWGAMASEIFDALKEHRRPRSYCWAPGAEAPASVGTSAAAERVPVAAGHAQGVV